MEANGEALFLVQAKNESELLTKEGVRVNEITNIFWLLLAPIFTCLAISLLVIVLYRVSRSSRAITLLLQQIRDSRRSSAARLNEPSRSETTRHKTKYGVKPIWTGDIVDESIESTGQITPNIRTEMPKKPQRYKTSGN